MSEREALAVTLAISGSNLTGDVPFSVALRDAHGAVNVQRAPSGVRGDLTTLCGAACQELNLTPAQVERVHLDVGPGSYTGLRVAVTFVRLLQGFGGVVVHAVDSLALLALHATQTANVEAGARLRPMLDARRGRYHTGLYEWRDGRVVECEPQAAPRVAAATAQIATGEFVVMPAAFAEQMQTTVQARGAQTVAVSALSADLLLRAEALPMFAAQPEDLEPRYLMASYAED